MDTSGSNHKISSFNELVGEFSRFNYSKGVNKHWVALEMGTWGMILHCDILVGQSTLPD